MKHPGKTQKKPSIAYTMTLSFGLILEAKKSANAWWMDQEKVHSLIAAFKIGATIEEACSYVGITLKQYKYFTNQHPVFIKARRGFVLQPNILAQMAIVRAINKGDVKVARWWLAKKEPDEFGPPSMVAAARRKREIEEQQKEYERRRLENMQISDEEKELFEKLRIARRKRIEQQTRDEASKKS